MAAVVLQQEGSRKPGNRDVLKGTRQPHQFNTSVKFWCSPQAQKGSLIAGCMRFCSWIQINTLLYTGWFVIATNTMSFDPQSFLETRVWAEGAVTPLVWPVCLTCLGLTPQMVKPLHPEWKPLTASSSEELFTKVLQGLGSGRGCQMRKTD